MPAPSYQCVRLSWEEGKNWCFKYQKLNQWWMPGRLSYNQRERKKIPFWQTWLSECGMDHRKRTQDPQGGRIQAEARDSAGAVSPPRGNLEGDQSYQPASGWRVTVLKSQAQRLVRPLVRGHSSHALSGKNCARGLPLRLPLEEILVLYYGVPMTLRPDDTNQKMVTPWCPYQWDKSWHRKGSREIGVKEEDCHGNGGAATWGPTMKTLSPKLG